MGAWDYGVFDNDTAQDFLHDVCELLAHCLIHGMWSQFTEEGVAASGLLLELPKCVRDKLGPRPFAEAIECIEQELKKTGDWDNPRKRRALLSHMKGKLTLYHTQLDEADKKARERMRTIFRKKRKPASGRRPRAANKA